MAKDWASCPFAVLVCVPTRSVETRDFKPHVSVYHVVTIFVLCFEIFESKSARKYCSRNQRDSRDKHCHVKDQVIAW